MWNVMNLSNVKTLHMNLHMNGLKKMPNISSDDAFNCQMSSNHNPSEKNSNFQVCTYLYNKYIFLVYLKSLITNVGANRSLIDLSNYEYQ